MPHNIYRILFYFITLTLSSVNFSSGTRGNLQMFDGISNADIINGDIFLEIIEPKELRYTYRLKPAKDFGTTFNDSFCLMETALVPMDPLNACEKPFNDYDIEGNVAFAERGECSFLQKTIIAEEAGARALIVTETDLEASMDASPDHFIEMIDDKTDRDVRIPAAFLVGRSGGYILRTLKRLNRHYAIINLPVNLTHVNIHKVKQPPWLIW